ncbi:MAG: hypothetical protein KGJ01_01500 [Patescibacteria group bacterium]|nr:hypothetical protein [Patescibacteria group bacterium]
MDSLNGKSNKRDGQLLTEAIVAMGIFAIAIVGIIGIIARAVHEGRTVGDQFIAANLAAEGLEVTKNIIDSNVINKDAWNAGIAPGSYQVSYLSTSLGQQLPVNAGSLSSEYNTPGLRDLLFSTSTHVYGYASGSPTTFKRFVAVSNVNNNPYQIRVISTVLWITTSRSGNVGSVTVATDFLNWR